MARRPPLLGAYLDFTREQSRIFSDKYNAFVMTATETQSKCESIQSVSVNLAGKVCFGAMAKDEVDGDDDELKTPLVHAHDGILDHIVEFYAKFNNKGPTFSDIDNSSRSWGMHEIETFCRDFSLVPKLISREELRNLFMFMIQELMTKERERGSSNKKVSRLSIDLLREFLARMAVFIYGKPGIVALLAQSGVDIVDGNNPADRVKNLIHYLKLRESESVKRLIRTVGRTTQGKHNYVSAGEIRDVATQNHKEDLRYRDMLKESVGGSSKSSQFAQPKLRSLAPRSLADERGVSNLGARASSEPALGSAGSRLPPEISEMITRPTPIVSPPPLVSTHLSGTGETSGSPGSLTGLPNSTSPLAGGSSSRPSSPVFADAATSAFSSTSPGSPISSSLSASQLQHSRESDFELEASQELYTPDLAALLLPFTRDSYNDSTELKSRVVHSHGAFLDLGRLEPYSLATVKLHITNTSNDDLRFDITAHEFATETNVRTHPSQLIPGLARKAFISFRAGASPCCHVGRIAIKFSNDRNLPSIANSLEVPVFYFVGLGGLDDKSREHSPLTLATLQGQMRHRLGVQPQNMGKQFGRRMAGGSRDLKFSGGLDDSQWSATSYTSSWDSSSLSPTRSYNPNSSFMSWS